MTNQFTRAAKRVRKLERDIKTGVDAQIGTVMKRMEQDAQRNVLDDNTFMRGTLVKSISHHNVRTSEMTIGGLRSRREPAYAQHIVRADAPHAPYVEYGTGVRQRGGPNSNSVQFKSPSMAPTSAIYEWMQLKGVRPRVEVEGGDSQLFAAHRIAERIKRLGSRAHPFMRPAWHANRASLSNAHARGVQKALRRF